MKLGAGELKNNKNWLVMVALLFSVFTILTACSENTQGDGKKKDSPTEDFKTDVQLGTGTTGGTYFPLGQEMANVWNDTVKAKGFNVSAVSTDSSIANLAGIGRGELQLGMAVHVQANEALKGEGDFGGVKIKNFGFMGHIYPEVMQIVTLGSTGVDTIADLKGKKVAIGPAGSGTQVAAKLILEAYGLKDGDYVAYHEGFGDAKGKLQDGNIDASFALLGLPAASIEELQAITKDVKFLEIDGPALKSIEKNSPYKTFEIPADVHEWLKKPVSTISAFAILVGSTSQISEELGYEMTKALFENSRKITHTQAKYITKENALKGSEGLPIHPGSEKYFKEVGIIK